MRRKKIYNNYIIDTKGRLYSLRFNRYMKPTINGKGYYQTVLCYDGKRVGKKIHRLVAEAFLNRENDNLEVNHKDGNKLNNNVKNLEWVSKSENIKHAFSLGLYPMTEKKREASRINGRKHLPKFAYNTNCMQTLDRG